MVSVLLRPDSLMGKHKKIQQSINENTLKYKTDTQEQQPFLPQMLLFFFLFLKALRINGKSTETYEELL